LPKSRRSLESSTKKEAAECVCGVLLHDKKVLVEKRQSDDEADPGLVMIPGGHVEAGESFEEALKREMKEELGILVSEITPVHTRYYTASNGERQKIHYFHVRSWSGRVQSNEAERVYWESNWNNLSDETERKVVLKLLSKQSS
jgi:mutator protein MutT